MSGAEFARYARDLAKVAAGLDTLANVAAERVGRGALSTARDIVAVDTGETRDEMRLRRKGSVSILESSTRASVFNEYGTSVMAPQPFIGPAVDRWAPELVREVEGIRDGVVKAL